jgi:hypothetical protein
MIYLASHKGKSKGFNRCIERVICWATRSEYSHTEICVGNPFDGVVLCVSSVDAEGGVRGVRMQLSPADWDIVAMPWVSERSVKDFLTQHHGCKYDFIGCVRSVLPFVSREHPEKWFCSEVAGTIIGIKDAWRFPPGDLHSVISSAARSWNI